VSITISNPGGQHVAASTWPCTTCLMKSISNWPSWCYSDVQDNDDDSHYQWRQPLFCA